MHYVFNVAYLLAGVLLLPVWLWKLTRGRRYRAGLLQRLGCVQQLSDGWRVWIHCASVGEAGIPRPLVERLRELRPNWDIVFSTNTDTGLDRLRALYPGATVFFMPADFSVCVRRTFRRIRPTIVLLVELEVWPNFMYITQEQHVPVGIVSGRIGARSRKGLRRLNRICDLWSSVKVCCARSADDQDGFVAAGITPSRVFNCGSLKYDALRTNIIRERDIYLRKLFSITTGAPVLVAGSTAPGEEEALARIYLELRRRHADLRMIVIPRHIERVDDAEKAFTSLGLGVARKGHLEAHDLQAGPDDVVLVDTIGDLVDCYGLSDCVFVGRSLLKPGGGQNMMEPAALGKPVVVGPYTGNFRPEMRLLRDASGISVVANEAELAAEFDLLLSNKDNAQRMGRYARGVVTASRGVVDRTMTKLDPLFE
jgi:3-deoxy-D-manno-octulosonic-acid transferase